MQLPIPIRKAGNVPAAETVHSKLPIAPATRKPNDFYWADSSEPHATRRSMILAAHPEIKTLMGPCPRTKWIVLATIVFQTLMCSLMPHLPFYAVFLLTYVVSGTLNHMMMMAIHEISHNLAFKSAVLNRWLSIAASLPIGLPVAISFRRYHLEHHKYQGENGMDVDIPVALEARLFKTWYGKLTWMMLQPFFYTLRPLLIKPKQPGMWEAINLLAVICWDIMLYTQFGPRALFYSVVGSLMGSGAHPVAGHFIAEHGVLSPGHETYSYYGPLNALTFNVGYHNEHHDFANIPGSRLPMVRKYAPEFYNCLPTITSYTAVIWHFVFSSQASLFDRVKRNTLSDETKQEIAKREHRHHARWYIWS